MVWAALLILVVLIVSAVIVWRLDRDVDSELRGLAEDIDSLERVIQNLKT